MTIFRFSFLLGGLLAVAACDTDLYQDTSACRDDDWNTVCPIDGDRDGTPPNEPTAPAVAARSQSVPHAEQMNQEYEACVRENRAGCDNEEMLRQDGLLNAKYRAVMARLRPEEQRALQASERSWIAERDKRCGEDAKQAAAEATIMGPGAAAEAVEAMCKLEATKSRIQWLDSNRKRSQ